MKNRLLAATIAALGSLALNAPAAAITIDGSLSDWGLTTSWGINAGINAKVEDQTGTSTSYYLSPGYGGQAYDAEALYTTIVGETLYIALVTGHNPRTLHKPSGNSYGAGDFAIDFGKNGSYEVGINFNHCTAATNGTCTAYENSFDQGGVYGSASWNLGLWNAAGGYAPNNADPTHPTHLTGGTRLGSANFAYTTVGITGYGSKTTDQHFFYEMSLDVSLLRNAGWDGTSTFNIHWTENCANDSILVGSTAYVPEPGSLALLGLGLFGLAALRQTLRERNRGSSRTRMV